MHMHMHSCGTLVCSDHHLNRCRFNSACLTIHNGPPLFLQHRARLETHVGYGHVDPAVGSPLSIHNLPKWLLPVLAVNLAAAATSHHFASAVQ
jgi:hypothetical protein